MLQGDLATFPLGELFQWLDQSRRSGVVELEAGEGAPFWLQVADRRIVRAARPLADPSGVGALARWTPGEPPGALGPEACADRIVDLFLSPAAGRFTLVADAAGFDDGVALDLGLVQMALEGLRRLDEWPSLEGRYPTDAAALAPGAGADGPRSPGERALVEAARRGTSIAEARLALGLSRPAVLRRIEALRERGLVRVEGVSHHPDPVASLLAKASLLVAARQFDEAAIVLRSLLASDPSDRRVRDLLREAEREQVASLYEELSPVAIPALGPGALERPAARRLTATEREVAGRVNGVWDVAGIVLASPLREVETLRALRRLARLGLAALREP